MYGGFGYTVYCGFGYAVYSGFGVFLKERLKWTKYGDLGASWETT